MRRGRKWGGKPGFVPIVHLDCSVPTRHPTFVPHLTMEMSESVPYWPEPYRSSGKVPILSMVLFVSHEDAVLVTVP